MNNIHYCSRLLSREEAVAIYREIAPAHFPDDELKPVAAIEALYGKNAYLGLGLYQKACNTKEQAPVSDAAFENMQEILVGYALFLTVPGLDTALLDYYAILEEYRELGLGSFFLREMKRYFAETSRIKGILIETEDPAFAADEQETLLRNRRNAFYHKNGAHQTGVACTLFGVPFQIHFMPTKNADFDSSSQSVAPEDTAYHRQNMETLYRFMLPDSAYEQYVIWR